MSAQEIKELHQENSQEVAAFMKMSIAFGRRVMKYMWIGHIVGFIWLWWALEHGRHLAAFIIFILLIPDTDDVVKYARMAKESLRRAFHGPI